MDEVNRSTADPTLARPEPRFNTARPPDNHRPTLAHRYRHYTIALAARLKQLAAELDVWPAGRVLDYGCADQPYRELFPSEITYLGADLPGNPAASIEISGDGSVPVETESFDAVLSTQVLEHVFDPELHLSECYRALKPGGRLLLSTHGIFVYHPDPEDYWRWTAAGLQAAIRQAGFEIRRIEGVLGLLPLAIQLAQDAVYWKLPVVLRPPLAVIMQSLIALTDRFYGDGSRRMNASAFVVVAEKPHPDGKAGPPSS